MDKQMYKQLVADMMRKESKLQNQIKSLKEQILELHMENAELKDKVLNNGGNYAETDGYEVGSPSDYEFEERSDKWKIEQFNRNRTIEDQVKSIKEMKKEVSKIFGD